MLQQTRAAAVIPYYERFLKRFPTVADLAAAGESEVLALWSGLGYYSRARNLRRAARQIAAAGGFPRNYDAIRALPGIGDYTAAAVGSIAFGLPYAVLDGNVLRVVARVTNDAGDIAAGRTRERFRETAQQWLDARDPGHFNQALMELGATVCLPRNPLCLVCPLGDCCRARQEGTAAQLPVKLRTREPVRLSGTLLVVRNRGRILLRQRDAATKRMAGFWDLPAPEDLPRFYEAWLAGRGDFINGVRLVYPMQDQAMRFFNLLGNKFFSQAFSWLLGQSIRDTLCGTKVLSRRDYQVIAENRSWLGDFDPFGDFDLIFGAARFNLKIADMPVRYGARKYGETNIQRWSHGWMLLRMVMVALRRIKFL